jgi:sugar transferase (PEP-CTERM/EpsH1 system associated)
MKRLLFIAHHVPYPPDKGERVRAYNEIVALASHFRVTLAAFERGPGQRQAAAEMQRWCQRVLTAPAGGPSALLVRGPAMLATGSSITRAYFRSRRLSRQLAQEAAREPFDLAIGYSSGVLDLLLGTPAGARIMDLVDADSAKWSSYADSSALPRRWLYRQESRGVAALERRALERCDAVVIVSQAEAQMLPVRSDRLHVMGNGVDTDYFAPARPWREQGEGRLVFTGSMGYRPNVQGVCWFVEEVWPLLRQRHPALTLTIVGRDPAPAVQRLAQRPGITVTGAVPDVRPYLREATVAVAPLHIARGVQNKVLEAMSMGVPVVASPAALEGLDIRVGTDALEAESPVQWVHQVSLLLGDTHARWAMSHAAREAVLERYQWPRRLAGLVELCHQLSGGGVVGSSRAV